MDREKSKFRRYWYVKWFSNLISKMVLGEAVPLFFYSCLPIFAKKKNKNKLDSWTNNTYE